MPHRRRRPGMPRRRRRPSKAAAGGSGSPGIRRGRLRLCWYPAIRWGRRLVCANGVDPHPRDLSLGQRLYDKVCFQAVWAQTYDFLREDPELDRPAVPVAGTNGDDVIRFRWPNDEETFTSLNNDSFLVATRMKGALVYIH